MMRSGERRQIAKKTKAGFITNTSLGEEEPASRCKYIILFALV